MNRPLRAETFEPGPARIVVGTVERVTFHNRESGFCVLRVRIPGRRLPVPVTGRAQNVQPGATVSACGAWHHDPGHGLQFRALTLDTAPPTEREGIARYLGAGLVPGLGPELAGRIAAHFGPDTFAVIGSAPERLAEVAGIGARRAARIGAAWRGHAALRTVMEALDAHGLDPGHAPRVVNAYGERAIEVVRREPYRLAREIRGIGFRTADALAIRLGMEPDAPARLAAGIVQALLSAMDDGHCALEAETLARRVATLLNVGIGTAQLAVALAARNGSDVVADTLGGTPHLFLKGLHGAEQAIAARLTARASGHPPWSAIDADRALPWVEERIGRTLSRTQAAAVRLALGAKLCVLTGGPGVGKTATLDAILRILGAKGVRAALAAPTGRAAKRMSEQTGLDATTLHRLLGADPCGGFGRDAANPLDCDLLVIDETSMVDVPLMHAVLAALPERAALILVGDADQLPAVGPGQVLADLIAADQVLVVRLEQAFRQAAASRIVANAHRVRSGLLPLAAGRNVESDFHLVTLDGTRDAVDALVSLATQRIPARFGLDAMRDVQVLTPMQRGTLGAQNLNVALQRSLNPDPPVSVERYGRRFGVGDRVMVTRNDYERDVFNGDTGIVAAIDEPGGTLTVEIEGRAVAFPLAELDALVLAYATTIHKAQGSEYPAVVLPLTMEARPMLARNLLYTGLTRGRSLVVLMAEPEALRLAVRATRGSARRTKLREWLAAGVPDLRFG